MSYKTNQLKPYKELSYKVSEKKTVKIYKETLHCSQLILT